MCLLVCKKGESVKTDTKTKLIPFVLTLCILIVDQITKALVVHFIPYAGPYKPANVAFSLGGDFLQIIHARNLGIGFSIGRNSPESLRPLLFTVIPVLILLGLLIYYFVSKEFTKLQRWAFTGILGGGIGNLIDRIFRPEGVVDFIDVKFYGIFGLARWPTFNIADASVVICGILLVITLFFQKGRRT